MFSKDEYNHAIEVIREIIEYIKVTCPSATVEIENLEFAIESLEAYRDREKYEAEIREQEKLALLKGIIF